MSQSFSPSFSTAFKLFQSLKLREDLLQSSSREAMRVLSQPDFWTSAQRGVFRQAFEGVLFESLDHLALARFTLPAEYVAAMIVAFVHPVNYLAACKWSEHHGVDADSMAISVNETAEYEPFTARQLFAIVCNIVGDAKDAVGPSTFAPKCDAAIADRLAPDISTLPNPNEDQKS